MSVLLKNIIPILIMLMAGSLQSMAQDEGGATLLRGKVIDKATKQPLEGASVSEQDKEGRIIKSTSTDVEGNFVLRITNPQDSISVTYIGYKTFMAPIRGRTTLNVQLEDDARSGDEVVVISQRRTSNGLNDINERDLTTSVGRINAEAMEEMAATSIDQALQGRLSGVDITATSGDPGAAMNIRIRGVSSLSSNGNPLIVLDGMPFETEIPSDFNFGAADEQGYASLLNISPADIKDITVLKDAAATAVWGSRAANGVLVITTKRGRVSKPTVMYTMKANTSFRPAAIPMLNGDQYSTLIPEAVMNRLTGLSTLNYVNSQEFNYDPYSPYWYYNYSNNTNWVDEISRQGYLHDHTVSLSGGGEKARYFASIGYLGQTGTVVGNDLQRMNARINLDYNVSNKLQIFTSIAYTYTDRNRNYTANDEGAIRNVAYLKMPNMSVFEYDEFGNLTTNYLSPASNIQGQYSRIYNPLAMATQAIYSVLGNRIVPRFQLKYTIIKGVLTASADVQFDINSTNNSSFLPQIATGRPNTETVVNRSYNGDIDGFGVTTRTSLNYTPKLKNRDHVVMAFANLFTGDYTSNSQEVMKSNAFSSLLVDITADGRTQNAELQAASRLTQNRTIGAVVQAQYGFKDKYLINGSLRGDGSSRFGSANRYGLFPGVSMRYRISGENFFKTLKFLDDLSFRASYAQSGNAPRTDYSFFNTYNTVNWSYQGQSGVYPSSMELSNLRWETVVGRNLGLNISLFGGRVRSDIDVYFNQTKDLFSNNLRIGSYTGYTAINMNVGTMENRGWEFALWTQPYKTKELVIGFDFNISQNENIITEISPYYPMEKGNMNAPGNYLAVLQMNNPFGSFYGYRFKGVYKDKESTIARDANGNAIIGPNGQTVYMRFAYPTVDYMFQPGDAMYEDINHDGNIDYKDVVYLGNNNPRLYGGFGPNVSWKNGMWRLSAFFNYRYDVDVVNGTKMNTTRMNGYDNQSTAVLRRWRNEGDITDIPRAVQGTSYNWLGSDKYVEDASFLRFRTITLRYTVPPVKLRRVGFKSLSAYLTAENLYTFTNYTGQDPEVSMPGGDAFKIVTDNSMTPPSKNFTIGLVAGF
ncbi:SusC/RagA family TonB-linked outer membrane protein [Niabella hibiscisoli]|uniref:SusC/RagA family TonB-linked outer membrane protein n=1 Tax=Niabella hibiscisoli TaxID=1825928 RepID=UPI001F1168C0|nr:SusC/RagA family TonB-linked outer membrane protein [Niabella hibiscisoli]MCH5717983.1 SusC/RagA family TonB-linked outer membrane protein [Niabella hibiscisoli]